jgi:hypothetical protein
VFNLQIFSLILLNLGTRGHLIRDARQATTSYNESAHQEPMGRATLPLSALDQQLSTVLKDLYGRSFGRIDKFCHNIQQILVKVPCNDVFTSLHFHL